MKTLIDSELGVLLYEGAWICQRKVNFDNEKIDVAFQAFEDENVSIQQKDLYTFVIENFDKIVTIVNSCLSDKPDVKIHTLFFDRFGAYGFLCDCDSDEHGIVVKFSGRDLHPEIGEQDILI